MSQLQKAAERQARELVRVLEGWIKDLGIPAASMAGYRLTELWVPGSHPLEARYRLESLTGQVISELQVKFTAGPPAKVKESKDAG